MSFMQTEKKCRLCGHIKPTEEFDKYFNKKREKYVYQSLCRPCRKHDSNKRSMANYLKNPEIYKIKKREYRATVHNVYVREQLRQRGFTTQDLNENPEIVEVKRLQILLQRKLK